MATTAGVIEMNAVRDFLTRQARPRTTEIPNAVCLYPEHHSLSPCPLALLLITYDSDCPGEDI